MIIFPLRFWAPWKSELFLDSSPSRCFRPILAQSDDEFEGLFSTPERQHRVRNDFCGFIEWHWTWGGLTRWRCQRRKTVISPTPRFRSTNDPSDLMWRINCPFQRLIWRTVKLRQQRRLIELNKPPKKSLLLSCRFFFTAKTDAACRSLVHFLQRMNQFKWDFDSGFSICLYISCYLVSIWVYGSISIKRP